MARSRENPHFLSMGDVLVSVALVSVAAISMRDFIWGFSDLVDDVEDAELVELFGPYVTVIKSLVVEGRLVAEYVRRMPSALAVEEVLRSPTNGVLVNRARIVGMEGKWDMSMSAPYYNPWNQVDLEED